MTNISKAPGENVCQLGGTRTMELEAPLSETERHMLERQISDASAEMLRLEAHKKKVVTPINEDIKAQKARLQDLHSSREKGTCMKPVAVRTMADFFRGEKWVERLDMGEPEEVPETRVALTDGERQALLPGVVVEGDTRPNAPVVSLFGGAETAPVSVTWASLLPKPLERWKVEEVGGTFNLVNSTSWQVWAPFRFNPATGLTWADTGALELPEDKQALLAEAAGGALAVAALLSAVGEVLRARKAPDASRWRKTLSVDGWKAVETEAGSYSLESPDGTRWGPFGFTADDGCYFQGTEDRALPDEQRKALDEAAGGEDEGEKVLHSFEVAVEAHARAAVPEFGLELHPLPGLEGWGLYLHEGFGWLRPPNVDRFTAPCAPSDKGPLEWSAGDECWQLGDAAPPEMDDFVKEYTSVMKCADSLVKQGKVVPPAGMEPEDSEPEDDGAMEPGAGVPTDDRAPLSPGEAAASTAADEEPDAGARARKLSDSARMVLKLLAQPDAPSDAPTIGSRCRCKAGSVLNGLEAKGLVTATPNEGTGVSDWHITDAGRAVAAALQAGK